MQKPIEHSMISMTEVQPVIAQLFAREGVTPVRLGTIQIPKIAIVPWHLYLAWWAKLRRTKEYTLTVRIRNNASRMFMSYRNEIEPLLQSEPGVLHVVVVKTHGREVGAVMTWADWVRFAPEEAPEPEHSVPPTGGQRSYGIVFAHKHLSQFVTQFAQEEAQGMREPITITKQGEPVMAILPWPLYQQWQNLLTQAEPDETVRDQQKAVARRLSASLPVDESPIPWPWPAGTAVQLSPDGLAIYKEAHGDDARAIVEYEVFHVLGVVDHYVSRSELEDEASPRYHEAFGDEAFDNAPPEEAGFTFFTSLFAWDSRETGILMEHEIQLAPKQPHLETDQQFEQFLRMIEGRWGAALLPRYRYHRLTALPQQALEAAFHDGLASGYLPWGARMFGMPRLLYVPSFEEEDQVEAEDWISFFLFTKAGETYQRDPEHAAAFLTEWILEELRQRFEEATPPMPRLMELRQSLLGRLAGLYEESFNHDPDEETCNEAGREILHAFISCFRPDFLEQNQ